MPHHQRVSHLILTIHGQGSQDAHLGGLNTHLGGFNTHLGDNRKTVGSIPAEYDHRHSLVWVPKVKCVMYKR